LRSIVTWILLEDDLAYERHFVAWRKVVIGAPSSSISWVQAPLGLMGIHTNMPGIFPADIDATAFSNKLPKGGHFAAWEQPKLFSEEVRAGFQSLRN
jgi:hypothetical protein